VNLSFFQRAAWITCRNWPLPRSTAVSRARWHQNIAHPAFAALAQALSVARRSSRSPALSRRRRASSMPGRDSISRLNQGRMAFRSSAGHLLRRCARANTIAEATRAMPVSPSRPRSGSARLRQRSHLHARLDERRTQAFCGSLWRRFPSSSAAKRADSLALAPRSKLAQRQGRRLPDCQYFPIATIPIGISTTTGPRNAGADGLLGPHAGRVRAGSGNGRHGHGLRARLAQRSRA